MIIKVPIYVEIEKVSETADLPEAVTLLHKSFSLILRKSDFRIQMAKYAQLRVEKLIGDFKIIPKEKALEYLRTKK